MKCKALSASCSVSTRKSSRVVTSGATTTICEQLVGFESDTKMHFGVVVFAYVSSHV